MFRTMIYCHLSLYKDFDKKIEKKFNSAKLGCHWRINTSLFNSLQSSARQAGDRENRGKNFGGIKIWRLSQLIKTIFHSYLKVNFEHWLKWNGVI